MLTSTETHPFTNFELTSPNKEDTSTQALIPMRPMTPPPKNSEVVDLTPDHLMPTYSLISALSNLSPSFNIIALHSSPKMMKLWNHLLQSNLREDNGGLQVDGYSIVQAVSPFYIRVLPSDETKLKSGLALRLEDPSISTFLLVEEYPINFIHLKEPIRREKGYIIYKFASDLFSRFCTLQPEKAPTDLIAILEYHTHEEAAHLISKETTLHQRVLEDEYALPPLRTWENEWSPQYLETLRDSTWSKEVDRANESSQLVQEGEKYLMM